MNFQQFSPSERRLIAIFATIVAVLLNVIVVRFFMTNRAQIAELARQKSAQIESLDALSAQSEVWDQRAKWLQKLQPKLESEAAAGNTLLTFLKEAASKHGITLSKQQLASARNETGATAIPVQFELKGNWKGFCGFLIDLQAPDRFLVVQQARLKVDSTDATVMQGDFTIAKWFAPR